MSPLHSRGTQRQARGQKEIRIGCLTPAFSGAQKRAEMLCLPCILRGPHRQVRGQKEISFGYLTPAFSGPKRGQKFYATPTFLGAPSAKRGEQNK